MALIRLRLRSWLMNPLGRNTGYLLIGNAMSAVLSFGLTILIGRGWGDEGLGYYGNVLAWIYPLSLLVEMGIGTHLTRHIARDKDGLAQTVWVAFVARLIIGGCIMAFVMLIAWFIGGQIAYGVLIASPLLLVNPLYSIFTAVMRGHELMRPIAYLNVGMLIVQVALTALGFVAGWHIGFLLAINTLTSSLQMLVAYTWVRRHHLSNATRIETDIKHTLIQVRQMIGESVPFAVAAVLAAIQSRGLLIVLGMYGGNSAVGLYIAAWRWLEAGRLLPMAFFDALYPRLAKLVQAPQYLHNTFTRATGFLVVYSLGFGLSLSLSASWLIPTTFGDNFRSAIVLLMAMAWVMVPLVIRQVYTLNLYARGRERYVNQATFYVVMIQLIIAFIFVPIWGTAGAVITLALGESILALALIHPFIRQPINH